MWKRIVAGFAGHSGVIETPGNIPNPVAAKRPRPESVEQRLKAWNHCAQHRQPKVANIGSRQIGEQGTIARRLNALQQKFAIAAWRSGRMILQFIELDALVRSKQKIGVLGIAMITPVIQMLTLIRDAAGIGRNPRHSYINKLAVLMHVSQHL